MNDIDWFQHHQYLPDEKKALSEGEATYALREGFKLVYGKYPSDKSLAVLWAKSALETGRWKEMHCYNFGNIKKRHVPDDGHYFTMFRCGEILKGKEIFFDPPHPQTHFRAWKTPEDGAKAYIMFVGNTRGRYFPAWLKVLDGDPEGYSRELSRLGYYTASVELYTKGVVRLFNEFMSKKEELLSWKPEPLVEEHHDTDVDYEPPVPPEGYQEDFIPEDTTPEPIKIIPYEEREIEKPKQNPVVGIFSLIWGILRAILAMFGSKK
jgi:hypothetical protein